MNACIHTYIYIRFHCVHEIKGCFVVDSILFNSSKYYPKDLLYIYVPQRCVGVGFIGT